MSLIGCCSVLNLNTQVTNNQRDYRDLCRATSSVWDFSGRISDVSRVGERIERAKRDVCPPRIYTNYFSLFQIAEHFLQKKGFSFKWEPSGALFYWQVLPAFLKHPETGETVWFNQIQSHHASHLQQAPRFVFYGSFVLDRYHI